MRSGGRKIREGGRPHVGGCSSGTQLPWPRRLLRVQVMTVMEMRTVRRRRRMAAVTGRAVVAVMAAAMAEMMVVSPVGGPEGCCIIKKRKLKRTRSPVGLPGKGDLDLSRGASELFRNLQKCLQTHTGTREYQTQHTKRKPQNCK